MLGKLIKHELQRTYKLMLISHGFVLILSILLGIILKIQMTSVSFEITLPNLLLIGGMIFQFLLIGALSFGVQLYIAIRFYRNLFTDEGYLMFTLPTTPTTLLHSKLITGSIWYIFNIIMTFINLICLLFIIFLNSEAQELYYIINTMLGSPWVFLLFTLIGMFSSLLMCYACVCIGQLFNKNRVVVALVSYGIITMALQLFSFIYMIVNNLFTFSSSTISSIPGETAGEYIGAPTLLSDVYLDFTLPMIVFAALFYGICCYIMNKKINLV